MALIQELNRGQIDTCFCEAVRRRVPISVTCRVRGVWHNLRSGIIKQGHDKLWLQFPTSRSGSEPEVTEGLMLGLTFKLGHHKHIFNIPVETICQVNVDGGQAIKAVCVPVPLKMQRVQRRAFNRVNIPASRSVLATFWHGGQDGDRSVKWEGWVTNISAGGFQIRLPSQAAPDIDDGDIIGICIKVGQEFEPVLADAQFRQQISDDRGVVMLGFQFVGLNESQRGQGTLEHIAQIVRKFQRHNGRRRVSGGAA